MGVGSLSYYGKPRNSVFYLEKQKQMAGAWAVFRHRPRAAGCLLVWGGSGWFAAGAMASATHQAFAGSSQEKAVCKWVEKEATGFSICFWGKGSWRWKREIHRPIPKMPEFFLPRRDLGTWQFLTTFHQFLISLWHPSCWSVLKGRLFLHYYVFTAVAFRNGLPVRAVEAKSIVLIELTWFIFLYHQLVFWSWLLLGNSFQLHVQI